MHCFSFFRNQLWQHLIIYNSFRNMNMCLLEVAMYEKCRSSDFQSERGSKKFKYLGGEGIENFLEWRWATNLGVCAERLLGGQYLITCNVTFMYLLILFIVQNLKILTADPVLWQCTILGPNMDNLPQTIFFWKIILIPIYFLAPFIVQNLKKASPSGSRVMRICNVWAQNNPSPQWEFFQKTC